MKKSAMFILLVFGISSYGAFFDFEEFGVMNFDSLRIDYNHYEDQGVIINANPQNRTSCITFTIKQKRPSQNCKKP